MKHEITRGQFLALAGIGTIGMALSPETALAQASKIESYNDTANGTILLDYVDNRYPELHVTISDPSSTEHATLDPASVKIVNSKCYFDEITRTGETSYEIDIVETEFDKMRLSKHAGIRTLSSTSSDTTDTVASIAVNTTWSLSGNNKKINLTKVVVKFIEKKGELTGRGIFIKNADKQHKPKSGSIKATFTYSPDWGFREYHDIDREKNHFVNAWATARPSGMTATREIRCMVVYGG